MTGNEHPCPWHGEGCYSYDSQYAGMVVLSDEWCDEIEREYGYDYRHDYSDEFRKDWLERNLERNHTNPRGKS